MESKSARLIKARHLSAFVETTRSGSLKAAAERLFLSQPTVSKTLKDLETILGAALLTRGRGGLALTREGEIFLQFAEQSLAALGHGISSLQSLASGVTATLRIGALPSVAADLLPDAVDRFATLSPATTVTVEDGRVDELVGRLRSGALDFVIGRPADPNEMRGVSFTQLYSENVVFAAAPDHPMLRCTDPGALGNWLVLYPPHEAAIRPLVDRFMVSHRADQPANRLETVSGAFGRSMTLGPRRAVWIISRGVIARDIAAGRLATLPIDTSAMAGPIGAMVRAGEEPTPPMRLFRQALQSACDASHPA